MVCWKPGQKNVKPEWSLWQVWQNAGKLNGNVTLRLVSSVKKLDDGEILSSGPSEKHDWLLSRLDKQLGLGFQVTQKAIFGRGVLRKFKKW